MSLYLAKYTDKSFIVGSTVAQGTKPYSDYLGSEIKGGAGGRWNPNILDNQNGVNGVWIFPNTSYTTVYNLVLGINNGSIPPKLVTAKTISSPMVPTVLSPMPQIQQQTPVTSLLTPTFALPKEETGFTSLNVVSDVSEPVTEGYQLHCIKIIKPVEGETLFLVAGEQSWPGTVSNVKFNQRNTAVETFVLTVGANIYNVNIINGRWQIVGLTNSHLIVRK